MSYRPQFQHKTRQTQDRAAAFVKDCGGLAVVRFLPVLWLAATADEAFNRAQDGTIRS